MNKIDRVGEITEAEKDVTTREMMRDMEADGELHEVVAPMEKRVSRLEAASRKTQDDPITPLPWIILIGVGLLGAIAAVWWLLKRKLSRAQPRPATPQPEPVLTGPKPIGFGGHLPKQSPGRNDTVKTR